MTFNKRNFGIKLKEKIFLGNNARQIGKWAHNIFFEHCRELSLDLKEVVENLLIMEEGPEFEYTEQELILLAEMLINEEKDPIKKINDARTSVGHLKHLYKSDSLKLVIEEDVVGFYLIVYKSPNSEKSSEDYLFGSLKEAFQGAEEKFGVSSNQWELQKS